MSRVGVSLSLRVLLETESLNMAGTVGNVVKHRRAPIVIVDREGNYRLVYVPAISGMSVAHHYQRHLARIANEMGLPVTRMSLAGFYMKFSDNRIIEEFYDEVRGELKKAAGLKDPSQRLCEYEKILVGKCTVADVAGFLYTDGPVKRTSRVSFSYLIPALDTVREGAVGLVPQIHVRYTPTARERQQALINKDNASSLYTMTVALDLSGIGVLELCSALGGPGSLDCEERRKRAEAALKALAALIGNMDFGAGRARSSPHWMIRSMAVAAWEGVVPLQATPGHDKHYIASTLARAESLKKAGLLDEYKIVVYDEEGSSVGLNVEKAKDPVEAVMAARDYVDRVCG